MPRKRIPLVKYFFQFMLPAFLLSMKLSAQKGKVAVNSSVCKRATLGTPVMTPTKDLEQIKANTIREGKRNIKNFHGREKMQLISDTLQPSISDYPFNEIQFKELKPLLNSSSQCLSGRSGEVVIMMGGYSASKIKIRRSYNRIPFLKKGVHFKLSHRHETFLTERKTFSDVFF